MAAVTATTSAAESPGLDPAPPPAHGPQDPDVHVDAAVAGGGIAGVTTALLLKRGGARVALIEAAAIGSGATGCTTAKVSALQSTMLSTIESRKGAEAAATYAEASVAAVDQDSELAAAGGVECDVERRPAFTYAAHEGELDSVEAELEAARRAGLPVERVDGPGPPDPAARALPPALQ